MTSHAYPACRSSHNEPKGRVTSEHVPYLGTLLMQERPHVLWLPQKCRFEIGSPVAESETPYTAKCRVRKRRTGMVKGAWPSSSPTCGWWVWKRTSRATPTTHQPSREPSLHCDSWCTVQLLLPRDAVPIRYPALPVAYLIKTCQLNNT